MGLFHRWILAPTLEISVPGFIPPVEMIDTVDVVWPLATSPHD
jgi:hypothetical protein